MMIRCHGRDNGLGKCGVLDIDLVIVFAGGFAGWGFEHGWDIGLVWTRDAATAHT